MAKSGISECAKHATTYSGKGFTSMIWHSTASSSRPLLSPQMDFSNCSDEGVTPVREHSETKTLKK